MIRFTLVLSGCFYGAHASFLTRRSLQHPPRNPPSFSAAPSPLWTLRGGGAADADVSALVEHSFGWASNLGAPAALVAGAVIATLYENIRAGDLDLQDSDSKRVRFVKQLAHLLLLTAFGLEMICIFVTTVTGTVLMSRELDVMDDILPVNSQTTPLGFLRGNFEFEYLTARVTMLQGILNWLAAIGLTHMICNDQVAPEKMYLNRFIGWSLFSCVTLMVSFYNAHMTFYPNYFVMLQEWGSVAWKRFIWRWPIRPLSLLFVPGIGLALYWGFFAFFNPVASTAEPKQQQPKEVMWPGVKEE